MKSHALRRSATGHAFRLVAAAARDPHTIDRDVSRGAADLAPWFACEARRRGTARVAALRDSIQTKFDTNAAARDGAIDDGDRRWLAVRHLAIAAIAAGVLDLIDVIVVVLRGVGVPCAEIAARFGCTRRAIEKRYARASEVFA